MSWESKLRDLIEIFKDEQFGGMNRSVSVTENVSIHLSHWIKPRDELAVIISIDNWDSDTSRQLDSSSDILNQLGEIFEEEGYDRPTNFTRVNRDDPHSVKSARYRTTIENPFNGS